MSDAISKDRAETAYRIWDDLPRISVLTLLLWARNSSVPRARMDSAAAAIPRCSLVEIPNSTHDMNVDDPDALVGAVRNLLT